MYLIQCTCFCQGTNVKDTLQTYQQTFTSTPTPILILDLYTSKSQTVGKIDEYYQKYSCLLSLNPRMKISEKEGVVLKD